jgi:hypothetical protein
MNEILVVIPFCVDDAIQAEHLCDLIFLANKRVRQGHCLLVISGDCHAELWEKAKIAAEVAFSTVDMVMVPNISASNKNQRINRMMSSASEHVKRHFRLPWLWLEPDATPVKRDWLEKMADAYYAQPKKYAGSWFKNQENGEILLARIAIYPPDAHDDLNKLFLGNKAFNVEGGKSISQRSTKLSLVQEVAINSESDKVSENVVLVHPDKHSIMKARMRDRFETAIKK